MHRPEFDATLQWLEDRWKMAAYCTSATLSKKELNAVLSLAKCTKAYRFLEFDQLEQAPVTDEVTVPGEKMRTLVMLALQAKRAQVAPQSRVRRNMW